MQKLRWGIVGLGSIAHSLANAITLSEGSELTAVGSRVQAKADEFGDKYDVKDRHSCYEELYKNLNVDIVYIATPHPMHFQNCIDALNRSKHVMCEKPFTINSKELNIVIDLAKLKNLFLMEAMWTRFFPIMGKIRELIKSGVIGIPKTLTADFGFKADINLESRLFNLALGGGALLDVGVYNISLAVMILGEPIGVAGYAELCETGADVNNASVIQFRNGGLAQLTSSLNVTTPHEAIIIGTEGTIKLHSQWWQPNIFTLKRSKYEDEIISMQAAESGFIYEVQEAEKYIKDGKLESDIMPLRDSLYVMQTMDKLREQWGLKYPSEG